MTDAELDEILADVKRTRESSDLRFTAPWVLETVPALVAEVKRLRLNLVFAEGKTLVAHAAARLPVLAAVAQEREACAEIAAKEAQRLFALPNPQNRLAVQAIAVAMEKLAAAIRARGKSRGSS